MIDIKAVETELHNARQARIDAELACCDVEEFAEGIRRSRQAFMRQVAERRDLGSHWQPCQLNTVSRENGRHRFPGSAKPNDGEDYREKHAA